MELRAMIAAVIITMIGIMSGVGVFLGMGYLKSRSSAAQILSRLEQLEEKVTQSREKVAVVQGAAGKYINSVGSSAQQALNEATATVNMLVSMVEEIQVLARSGGSANLERANALVSGEFEILSEYGDEYSKLENWEESLESNLSEVAGVVADAATKLDSLRKGQGSKRSQRSKTLVDLSRAGLLGLEKNGGIDEKEIELNRNAQEIKGAKPRSLTS